VNPLGLVGGAGLGLGLGVVTSMTPAVINVSIVDAAAAGRRRFANGLGLGGAAADAIQAGLAFAGVGGVVLARPELVRSLAVVAALAIVALAVVSWRRRRPRAQPAGPSTADAPAALDAGLARGAATGFGLTLLNPAVLGAWVAVATSAWPHAAPLEAAVIAGGVGAGSALWFTLLARWVARIRPDHPALAAIPRIALVLLVAIAMVGVWRALGAVPFGASP
jgi:threonine/homoserine/homoserine lactone efflux protein